MGIRLGIQQQCVLKLIIGEHRRDDYDADDNDDGNTRIFSSTGRLRVVSVVRWRGFVSLC